MLENNSASLPYRQGQREALVKLGFIGEMIATPINQTAGKRILKNSLKDEKLYNEIARQVKEQNVPIQDRLPGPAYGSGPTGSPWSRKLNKAIGMEDEFISMPKQLQDTYAADFLAHELGHKHLQNKKYLKYLQDPAFRMLGPLGSLGSLAAGYTSNKDRSALTDAAIVGLPSMPLLAGEGYASYKGLKLLREAGATPAQLRLARGNMLKALGTYGLQTLGAGALNYGAGRLLGGRAQ